MSSKAKAKEIKKVHKLLGEISESLNAVNNRVTSISEGQRNDRIATIHAGLLQFQQARKAKNEEIRSKLFAGAINLLNQGRALLIEELHQVLERGQREKVFSDKVWSVFGIDKNFVDYMRYIKAHSAEIGQAMVFINAASSALIEAYYELDEIGPASYVVYELVEYFDKLDTRLFQYKDLLTQSSGLKDVIPAMSDGYSGGKDKAIQFLEESQMGGLLRPVAATSLVPSRKNYEAQEFWVVLCENSSRSVVQFNGFVRNNFHIVQLLAVVGVAYNFRLILDWVWRLTKTMIKEAIREKLRFW